MLDNLSTGSIANLNHAAALHEVDIRASEVAKHCISAMKPQALIHHAAQPSLLKSLSDPLFDAKTNILATISLLQAAEEHGVEHVIYASSGAVYDPTEPVPYRESDRVRPPSPYAISKLAGEYYCLEWARRTGRFATIFRYGNVYGPRQVPVGENQLIPRAILGITGRLDFKVYGDGTHERDYVHVLDVARANALAVKKRPQGVYNVATCKGRTTNQVVSILAEEMGRHWEPEHIPQKFTEHEYIVLDNRKARAFGWEPEIELRAGLAMLLRREALAG